MNWQDIVKKYDLDVSIVNFDEVMGRIDAEYYRQCFLDNTTKLKSKKHFYISNPDYIERVTDGDHGNPIYSNQGVSYLKLEQIETLGLDLSNSVYVSTEYAKKQSKKNYVQQGDVLISMKGTLGKIGLVIENEVAILNRDLAVIRTKDVVLPEYLYLFLVSSYGHKIIEQFGSGGLQKGLYLGLINQIIVPTASSLFQKEIAQIIKEVYQIQRGAKGKYIEAEQLLLAELGLANYISNEVNTSIRNLFECLKDDRFDAEYWMPKYDEIATAIRNYRNGYDTFDNLFVIGSQTAINTESKYKYIELADVNSTLGTIENYTELQGKDLPSRGRMSLKKDDVIMSTLDGSLNKTALVTINEQNLIGSTGFFVLRKKYFEPEVALVLLKSRPIQEYIARQAQGTILTAIPKTSLSRILLPKISNEIQSKVKKLIQEAHIQKEQSKIQLEKAKRAVEIFIEQDEAQALAFLAS